MLQILLSWFFNPFSYTGVQAIPWAALAGVGTLVAHILLKRSATRTIKSSILAFLVAMWVNKLVVFVVMPAHTGFLNGYFWFLVITLLVMGSGALLATNGNDDKPSELRQNLHTGFLVLSLIVVPIIVVLAFLVTALTSFSQTDNRAALAHIEAASSTQTVPQTDPSHIVEVTQAQAYFAGRQVIASAGDNLGSRFQTNQADYALQSVKGHLYWVAPLVYHSDWSQLQLWGSHEYDSPGLISVDAENPNGIAEVKTGYHIRYLPSAWFDFNLQLHVYENGYDYGSLVDPTLEVNDDWQPFYTIAVTQPALTVTGDSVVRVIVVDAQSGAVQEFQPGKQPVWVDRILSSDMVKILASNWGRFLSAPWINFGGAGEMSPAGDPELVYNQVDKPIWVIPMTSNNSSDSSATGLLLYDTTDQTGTYYPGVKGIGVGDAVSGDFISAKENLLHYQVSSLQLYQIDNTPTWVAIYESSGGNSSFAAIGFMDARRLNTANVVFATDKQTGLQNYSSWLAMNPYSNGGDVSQFGKPSGNLKGVIQRIGWVVNGNQATYTILFVGDSHTFTATSAINPALPDMKEGDSVTYSYLDTDQQILSLQSIIDTTINR